MSISTKITGRRFPPSRSVKELDACFVVKDGGGQKLAYVYYASRGDDQRPSYSVAIKRGGLR